jgi:hypothetical protein
MRNLLAGIAILPILAGCALPPAITIASTVADGISYAMSGKSMTDHALSAVTSQDCAMLRALEGNEICAEYGADGSVTLVAAAPPQETWADSDFGRRGTDNTVAGATEDTTLLAAVVAEGATPDDAAAQVQPASFAGAVPLLKPATLRKTDPTGGAATLTVLGSYRDRANAQREVVRLAGLQPRIEVAPARHGVLYRVVSEASVSQARAAGVADAWTTPNDEPLQIATLVQ